ncbi:MAG: hypothetical protein AABO41_03335 [Acidobacteriota bacterium]
MNTSNRMWLKVWSIATVIFALGCVTGAAVDGLYRTRAKDPIVAQGGAVSMRDTEAYFATLQRELTLDEAQATSMRAVLENAREEYKSVCADVRPRYDVVREKARTEMRSLLSADQQPRFDSIVSAEDCRCPEQKKVVSP